MLIRLYQWRDLIVPLVDYHVDDLLYLRLAKDFYWGYEFDQLAFVRRPGFPIWIGVINAVGLSFALVQKLTYLLVVGLFSHVASKLGTNKALILGAAILSLYHPHAPALLMRITPDGAYTLSVMFCLSFFGLSTLASNRKWATTWGILSGLGAGWAYATREEHIVLLALFASIAMINVFIYWRLERKSFRPLILVASCTAIVPLLFSSINYYHFGVFALSEFSSKSFQSTYQAALSLPQKPGLERVPLSRDALESLYRVSPSWAKLKPHIEKSSPGWARLTSSTTGDPNEVGAGAFPWMLKSSVDDIGAYTSAKSADEFYFTLAEEIQQAQKRGELESRGPIISQLDPDWRAWLPRFLNSSTKLAGRLVLPESIIIPYHSAFSGTSDLKQLYHDTLKRPIEQPTPNIRSVVADGWMYQNNGRINSLEIIAANGEKLFEFSRFTDRDDVFELRKGFNPQRDCGFAIDADFSSVDTREAKAVFQTTKSGTVTIPLGNFLRRGSSMLKDQGINFHLDSLEIESSQQTDLIPAESANQRYAIGIGLLAIVSFGTAIQRARNGTAWQASAILWIATLCAWVLIRLALCSLIDATSFPCTPRYLFAAVVPLPWIIACLPALKVKTRKEVPTSALS